ncbi:BnaC05g51290D [Brassica napus]|uniref:BnaC05g51290D protein n=1 Tax=Brassica napus TaxID=3708 RepID=A0A078JGK3_BRANA|nr:BnaC05g51290D [Brassica napus]
MGEEKSVNNYDIVYIGDSSNSNDDHSNSDPTIYFRNISLSYFAAEPFEMLTKHNRFKELCLENDNPEAHYIEGILQYFVHKEKRKGLYHLRQASIGKKYLDKLQWKENLSTSDYCWKRVKKTLSTIPAIMETRYYTAMVNLEPRTECHPDNMAQVCKHCYYSKRLTQFVQFAMNQD